MSNEIKRYPAPWDLKGKGYIFIYRFKKEYNDEKFNVPEFLRGNYCGGFGSVMLVDYESSTAGPYKEFLLIPGKYIFKGKKLDTISKIYVSTDESVVNGRRNWGIPKEKADFSFNSISDSQEEININIGDERIASFKIKSNNIKFPVNTKLLPFPLVQEYENKYFYTNFYGKGIGKISKVEEIYVNEKYFPDITKYRPIMVIKVEDFSITFPQAIIEDSTKQ